MGMASEAPRVLIVDDDPAMTRLLSKWLEKAGYNVNCVYDGREATYAIEEECPSQTSPRVFAVEWVSGFSTGLTHR